MKQKTKKKILIAGGTGFIGYHLAKSSIKKGLKVTSISLSLPKKNRFIKKVKYITCDLSKKNLLKKKIKGNFDFIVNLSGHVDHKNKIKVYRSHFVGSKNLIDFFLKKNLTSFVQISSSMEYGKIKSPHSENFKCKPQSHYGISKNLATKYLIEKVNKKKFPGVILRLYQIYGHNQDPNRLISSTILGCINDRVINCSHGRQERDFLFIEDLISAIFKALVTKNAIGNIFNIGLSAPIKVKRVVNKIKHIIRKGKPVFGMKSLRKEESLKIYPNINKAKKILKWRPKFSFSKGINLTINSYLKDFKNY